MDDLWQDLKFGVRVLIRTPLLTMVAALSLAIGVGANTTVFTIVKAVLLEPLPVADASTLVSVYRTLNSAMAGAAGGLIETSFANYEDAEERSTSFDDLAASTFGSFNIVSGGESEQAFGSYATTNYFTTLGIEPLHGRFFGPEDERAFVVVLAHGLWQQSFGADPDIVGTDLRLNGRPFSVIGVAPPGFKGLYTLANQQMWVPVRLFPMLNDGLWGQALEHRGLRMFNIVGRLAPSIEAGEAEAELTNIARALEEEHPDWNRDRSFAVLPLDQSTIDPNQRSLYVRAGSILMGAVGLVLAIACANVGTLLLSRSRARRREIAMRLSLGASRARLLRQLLTEALLLAGLGGVMGVLIAAWCRPLLWQLRPPFLPEGSLDLGLDLTVLAFTAFVALAAGLLFGIAPAWQASRVDLVAATKAQEDSSSGRAPLRQAIVGAQAALSLVALAAAGFFVVSLGNALKIDPGFDHDPLAIATFDLGALNYSTDEIRVRFDRILETTSQIPGVERAALAVAAPLSFAGSYRIIPRGAEEIIGDDGVYVANNAVSPSFFPTLGLSAIEGRLFDARDTSSSRQVVIVNETFVRTYWPEQTALGSQIVWPAADGPWDVIGVVPDMKYTSLGEEPRPYFYRPLDQEHSPLVTLHVRASLPPENVLPNVLEELRRLEAELPLIDAVTVADAIRRSLWAARLGATLLTVFGLLALALAAVGIYGVLSHATEGRRRELGIRIALGARHGSIVRQVVSQGVKPVLMGIVAGAVAALAALRPMSGMLYGVNGTEPAVLSGAAILLGLIALAASGIPAWRTTRIDPVETLRAQ